MNDPGMNRIRKICEENAEKARKRTLREKAEEQEQKRALSQSHYIHLTDPKKWDESDYDIRSKGDHVELFHKETGEGILEAFSEKEAWEDLRYELYGRS